MRNELHSDLRPLGSEGEVHDWSIFVMWLTILAQHALCMHHLSPSTNQATNNNNNNNKHDDNDDNNRRSLLSVKIALAVTILVLVEMEHEQPSKTHTHSPGWYLHHRCGVSFNATSPSEVM